MNKGKEVFEILMRENADMLLAFLRTSVRDSHAVDEMFQETMVVAWRRMEDFDRDRSFGKWLREEKRPEISLRLFGKRELRGNTLGIQTGTFNCR